MGKTKQDALAERVEKLESWLGGQGIDLNPPAPVVEDEDAPAPEPKELTLEERIARLELAAQTQAGFSL